MLLRQHSILTTPLLLGLAIVALALVSCSTATTSTTGDEGLIWEAWGIVVDSYVPKDSLDSAKVSNGIIAAMLEAAGEPPDSFSTDSGRTRQRLPRSVPRELGNVWKAWTFLQDRHPEVDPHFLAEAAVKGLVAGLGDDSIQYLTPEAYALAQEPPTTGYEGIGAFVTMENGQIVLSPMRGGPAEKAGIRRGDVLVEVDGESIEELAAEDVTAKVRGAARTKVALKVQRPDESGIREFNVTRSAVEVPSVDVRLLPGAIGYIFISAFKDGTALEVLDALERLQQAEMLALILDLRLNPGGSMDSASQVASQFLSGGVFLREVDRQGQRTDRLIEEGGIATEELPMAVLVNESTASAAEALAGALQDTNRAKVVGSSTQGKGSANSYVELSDGSALHLPVSQWYTPLNRAISELGITPDILVIGALSAEVTTRDPQLGQAYDYLNNLLPPFR